MQEMVPVSDIRRLDMMMLIAKRGLHQLKAKMFLNDEEAIEVFKKCMKKGLVVELTDEQCTWANWGVYGPGDRELFDKAFNEFIGTNKTEFEWTI